MNEYEKLIVYLKERIDKLEEQIAESKVKSQKYESIKEDLDTLIENMTPENLHKIDIIRLQDILAKYKEQGNAILTQLTEVIGMQAFLLNDNINNPIKYWMLDSIEKIKELLIKIKQKYSEIEISEKDVEEKTELEKYLKILSEDGFKELLSFEDRQKFWDMLKTSTLATSDILLIVKNYIKYALSHQPKKEKIKVPAPTREEEKEVTIEDSQDNELSELNRDNEAENESSELKQLKEDYILLISKLKKYQADNTIIMKKIDAKDEQERIALLQTVYNNDKDGEGISEYLAVYGVTYDDVMSYILLTQASENIKEIENYIYRLQSLTEDELENLEMFIEDTKSIFIEYEKLHDTGKVATPNIKQYQNGENVVVFFRKNPSSKFLIEEDISTKCDSKKDIEESRTYFLEKIFMTLHTVPNHMFDQRKLHGFASNITTGNDSKSSPYIVTSEYSGRDCHFVRLKSPTLRKREGDNNNFRVSALSIVMPPENVEKIHAKSKNIILIVGAMEISNHNKNTEYSILKEEYETHRDEIQKILCLSSPFDFLVSGHHVDEFVQSLLPQRA